ncbi:phytoene desaturase family protein [Aspergillus neoniger CBS 115656]|uniref:Phytoene desaturase n=1 Tax=Aspergillus neoniger (strain CBS 115656) TaxID=1448310 RepID=A0A318Y3R3_ASPNB|nr:phytoene dehydrogenase [Aspergillus neoniger CBS 115656]PYH28419.1 phytoene dehydrogenase [Aspergillus neoniger CBS 115656]
MPKVIVVGAGAGGVATAARLAKQGFDVTVVEKNDFVGGRCSLIHHNGYRFDQGPSLLLMPEVFHETFHDLGTSIEGEGISLLKCEPNYRVWFSDHDSFDLTTDVARLKPQIEHHEGENSFHSFLGFMQESGRHYDLSMIHVLRRNFPGLFSMMRLGLLQSLFTMHPFQSIHSRVSRYFTSDKMRRIFTFGKLAGGVWYPAGGFEKVEKIGKRLGVEYRLKSPVSSIIISEDQSAKGVLLSSGEKLEADLVVVNADLVYAYNHLLPASKEARRLSNREASCSSISFFWSFDRVISELKVHNIFLAEEYKNSFDSIFKDHQLPNEPSFYVNVPSRIDPTAAPKGKDAVVVLVPTGHMMDSTEPQDWDTLASKARDTVFDTIETRTGARALRESLIHEYVETPASWEEKFNLNRGSILGLSHSFFNVLSLRPKTKHSSIKGLYFVGASTHPGTGVPVCLAGSKLRNATIDTLRSSVSSL